MYLNTRTAKTWILPDFKYLYKRLLWENQNADSIEEIAHLNRISSELSAIEHEPSATCHTYESCAKIFPENSVSTYVEMKAYRIRKDGADGRN